MIYKDDIKNLRQDISDKEGQKIRVKGALGRSKFFEKEAVIEKAYSNLFVIKYDNEESSTSYNYTDVLTRTIDLQVQNGESFKSIMPPKIEVPKRIRQSTNEIEGNIEKIS